MPSILIQVLYNNHRPYFAHEKYDSKPEIDSFKIR